MLRKISVIIPCYNVESFVEKSIRSALAQDISDMEIICINDGSTDETGAILTRIAAEDSRIRIVHQQNKGISESRNVGIRLAEGEFLMFLDSDDWFESRMMYELKSYLGTADVICFSYNRIFKNRIEPRKLNLSGNVCAFEVRRRIVGLMGAELIDPSQGNSLVTVWAKIYRTALIRNNYILFEDTKLVGTAEDALFNIQLLEFATTIIVLDKPFYNYRKNNASSFTSHYKFDLYEKWEKLYQLIRTNINGEPHLEQALKNRTALGILGLAINESFSGNSLSTQSKRLHEILETETYQSAFAQLNFKFFPLHWKLFYLLAKHRLTYPLALMTAGMVRILRGK